MSKTISVFGLGYVGSITAACLAALGNKVIGVDLSPYKINSLNEGKSPVLEPGVSDLIAEAQAAGRLSATADARQAVADSDISFLCVGTPSLPNGKLDLRGIQKVCNEIGEALRTKRTFHTVVTRSTVLPGTGEEVVIPTLESSSGRVEGRDFAVCSNPEFLREGTAVADFQQPPFTVIGARDPGQAAPVRALYEWAPGEIFVTTLKVAEMVKYACNAFHALKVGFANEIGTVCKESGIDPDPLMAIFTADTRLNISKKYLAPGFAFGGSCLPKDLRALNYRAKQLDLRVPLLESILPSNAEHLERAVHAILQTGKKKVAVLGLSFKPGTDDLRESPLVQLIKRLVGEGLDIRVWDEHVSLGHLIGSNRQYIEEVIPHIGNMLRPDLAEVVNFAQVIVLGTNVASPDKLERLLTPEQIVLDLVNFQVDRRPKVRGTYAGVCW